MDIDKEIGYIKRKLKSIIKYDTIGFVYDLKYLVNQLHYFHNVLIPEEDKNGDNTFFHPPHVPKVHQVAYFNLGHGFPKELYGGHWCYVSSIFKYKYLIIPTTSVKTSSSELDPDFEISIKIKDFQNQNETRLQVSDARIVDLHRIHTNKQIYDVETERDYIKDELKRILLT